MQYTVGFKQVCCYGRELIALTEAPELKDFDHNGIPLRKVFFILLYLLHNIHIDLHQILLMFVTYLCDLVYGCGCNILKCMITQQVGEVK